MIVVPKMIRSEIGCGEEFGVTFALLNRLVLNVPCLIKNSSLNNCRKPNMFLNKYVFLFHCFVLIFLIRSNKVCWHIKKRIIYPLNRYNNYLQEKSKKNVLSQPNLLVQPLHCLNEFVEMCFVHCKIDIFIPGHQVEATRESKLRMRKISIGKTDHRNICE